MATLEVTTFNKQLTVKTISKWYTLENDKLLLFQYKYGLRPLKLVSSARCVFIGLDMSLSEIYFLLLFI